MNKKEFPGLAFKFKQQMNDIIDVDYRMQHSSEKSKLKKFYMLIFPA